MSSTVMTLLKPKTVGIWVRVSTDMQGDSPIHHQERAKEYATNKNWQVEKTYILEDVSGKTIIHHTEYERMIEDIRSGVISGLIFSKFARLVRNTRELLEISDIFDDCSADLISLEEPINVSSSNGRLLLSVIGALAEWERKEIAARVVSSLPIRAKLGKSLGGAAPFGYKWEKNQMVVDHVEAPIRQLMYELYVKHKRKKVVANILNQLGYKTRNNSKWTATSVTRLIEDTTAKGVRRANYTRSVGKNKTWVIKPEHEWVTVEVEPIISVELWEQANKLINASYIKHARRPALTLFSGHVFCSCGTKMYVKAPGKYVCNKCLTKVRPDFVEKFFLSSINVLFSDEKIDVLLLKAQNELEMKNRLQSELIENSQACQTEMDRCYKLYISGNFESSDFARYYSPLKDKARLLRAQIIEVENHIKSLSSCICREDVISKVDKIFQTWWKVADVEQKIHVVEFFIKAVTVNANILSIEFQHSISFTNDPEIDLFVLSLLSGVKVSMEFENLIDVPYLKTSLDDYDQKIVKSVQVA